MFTRVCMYPHDPVLVIACILVSMTGTAHIHTFTQVFEKNTIVGDTPMGLVRFPLDEVPKDKMAEFGEAEETEVNSHIHVHV